MKKKLHKIALLIGIILIGVIVIMGIFGTKVFAPTIEVNDEKSFSLEEITSLQINMTKEKIRIIQTQTNEVKVHYHGISKQPLKLSTETNNGTIIVSSTRTTNLIYEDMYLDIYLPENYDKQIIIQATSSNITSEKTQADKISIITTSGNITLNDCVGNLDFKTSSGNVAVTYEVFEEQDVNIVTTSGSIQLTLPETSDFVLDAVTLTGKLQSDFPVNIISKKKMTGQVGTESNQITLKTTTGSISILKK